MTSFVPVSEEDTREFVSHVREIFGKSVKAPKGASDWKNFFEQSFFANPEKLWQEKDAEDLVLLSFTYLPYLAEDSKGSKPFGEVIQKFAKIFTENPETSGPLKLRLLISLFNLVPESSPLRLSLFISSATLALSTKQSSLFTNQLSQLDTWKATWGGGLKEEECRELYLLAARLCDGENLVEKGQEMRFQYLRLCVSKAVSEQDLKVAREAVLPALRSQQAREYDVLFDLKPVKELAKSDKKDQALFGLLRIFVSGDVATLKAFWAKEKATLEGMGFVYDVILKKVRSLSIRSLQDKIIKYSKLQELLDLSTPEEVEETIIDAVLTGCVEAKLDPENQEVFIERVAPREFTKESWKEIGTKLESWKKELSGVLKGLQTRRASRADED